MGCDKAGIFFILTKMFIFIFISQPSKFLILLSYFNFILRNQDLYFSCIFIFIFIFIFILYIFIPSARYSSCLFLIFHYILILCIISSIGIILTHHQSSGFHPIPSHQPEGWGR